METELSILRKPVKKRPKPDTIGSLVIKLQKMVDAEMEKMWNLINLAKEIQDTKGYCQELENTYGELIVLIENLGPMEKSVREKYPKVNGLFDVLQGK